MNLSSTISQHRKTQEKKIMNKLNNSKQNLEKTQNRKKPDDGLSLADFFALPNPGQGGPVNGGGHLCLKFGTFDMELTKWLDESGVERREISVKNCQKGSAVEFNVFDFGTLAEELSTNVRITLREAADSRIEWISSTLSGESRWTFEIDLTEERFFYLMRLVTGVDPFSGEMFETNLEIDTVEIHGDRFTKTSDSDSKHSARLLTVIVNGQPETNEFAVRKREGILAHLPELHRVPQSSTIH